MAAPPEVVAPVEEGSETGRRRLRRLARRLRPGPEPLFLVLFVGLAMWLFAPAWTSPTTTTLEGGDGDPAIFMWFLRWVPFALEHGHDLLVTHYLNYPDGVNLMWNTSLPLPGLLLAPVTTRWGPVLSFNLLLVLAYGLSAWCAYLAIRRFARGHLAAAVGGLIYGFSPAMRVQSHHLHMALAFLVPLMLLALHEILVRQRRSPWLVGVGLGLMAGAQLLIGEELLAMTALLGSAMFLLIVVTNLRRLRERWVYAAKAFSVALVMVAAIIVWPLSVQFDGPQRIHGDIQKTNYSNDLQSFILPGWPQALTWEGSGELVSDFAGGNSAYLGLPLLLVLVVLGVRWRASPVVRISLALMVVAAVLSLGPTLLVGGEDTGIRLPWAFFENLPLLPSLIPARLASSPPCSPGCWWPCSSTRCGRGRLAAPGRDRGRGGRAGAALAGQHHRLRGGDHPGLLHRPGRADPAPRQRRPGPPLAVPADLAGHDLAGRGRALVPDARRVLHRPPARQRPAPLRRRPEPGLDDARPHLRRVPAAPADRAAPSGPGQRLHPLADRLRGRRPDAQPGGHGRVPDRPPRPPAGGARGRLPVARPGGRAQGPGSGPA